MPFATIGKFGSNLVRDTVKIISRAGVCKRTEDIGIGLVVFLQPLYPHRQRTAHEDRRMMRHEHSPHQPPLSSGLSYFWVFSCEHDEHRYEDQQYR